jgi:hypothetical protein
MKCTPTHAKHRKNRDLLTTQPVKSSGNFSLKTHYPRRPQKVNLDGNAASHLALRLVVRENPDLESVVV